MILLLLIIQCINSALTKISYSAHGTWKGLCLNKFHVFSLVLKETLDGTYNHILSLRYKRHVVINCQNDTLSYVQIPCIHVACACAACQLFKPTLHIICSNLVHLLVW